MNLRAVLTGLSAEPPGHKADPARLKQVCVSIRDRYPAPSLAKTVELDVLAHRCVDRIKRHDWSGSTEAEIAPLMRAAASGRLTEPPMLLDFLAREAWLTVRPGLLVAFSEGFLEGWRPGAAHTARTASIVAARAADLPPPFADILERVPEIVRPDSGAHDLAARVVCAVDPNARMKELGFSEPHAPGFASAVGDEILRQFPPPVTLDLAGRIMSWCRPEEGQGIGDVGLVRALDVLLAPWRDRNAPEALRRGVLKWSLIHAGDPRLPGGSSHWLRAKDSTRRVVLSWLAERSIDAFMEVISTVEIAKRNTWRERRLLWTSLYREGVVTEAWPALHPAAKDEAERRFRATGDPAYRAFGRQEGGRKTTSLLVMRAGERIVVEGSHDYRVHVFDPGFPVRPELYRESYKDQDITLPVEDRRNTKAHLGNWQQWVRERLR
ncbi:EH signature domain-containing protein [Afifella sp. H1R]|uniref:EH signature domain-containing protein n=1 Tax=Afifella sp. H1R TaxID=2908841 RepID=UPI001F2A09FF|nr:EH signature domain-containing protein [Afifella sp. H1R]MCF1502460.1 EH signature domain-containing protein [Afifella sp. H1R]